LNSIAVESYSGNIQQLFRSFWLPPVRPSENFSSQCKKQHRHDIRFSIRQIMKRKYDIGTVSNRDSSEN